MQVAQIAEQDNFAVVGGGAARAFQIGNSAAAFKILSDTLYSDKHRAVSREVLCNAVDAHIVKGILNKPIEIKLTDSELTIQDFGPGIPDDRMVEIYATYFGSTKQHDDSQTGGFGLGSKSPFAYTDHFTVTSCHEGFRRVYALTVSDDDTGGAPAVKLMATAPCGEFSGVTVSIPIEAADHRQFQENIRDVVYEGGMNAMLNGEKLEANDYTELRKLGIGLFKTDSYGSKVQVLYGNVLYPLDANDGISKLYEDLTNWAIEGYDIIIAAAPSSVTVTPAREALGYNPRTIASLKLLMRRALHVLNSNKHKMFRQEAIKFIERPGTSRANIRQRWETREHAEKSQSSIIGAVEIARFTAQMAIIDRDHANEFLDPSESIF